MADSHRCLARWSLPLYCGSVTSPEGRLPTPLLPLAAVLLFSAPPDSAFDDPVAVVRAAARAVENDSVGPARARWTLRLARDSADPVGLLGLATLGRITFEDSTALPLFQRLIDRPMPRPDRFAVYGLVGLARVLIGQDRRPEADSLLMRARAAARALGDRRGEAEALLWMGNLRADLPDVRVGLTYLDSALAALPAEVKADDLRAMCRCRRAYLLSILGHPRAGSELSAALDFARRVQAPHAEVQCLRPLSYMLREHGLEDSSVVLLREAERILRRVRDRRNLAWTLARRADVQRDQGAYGEAREALHAALAETRASRHRLGEAFVRHLLGTLAFSLRDITTAAQHFDQAFAIYTAIDNSGGQMQVQSWQANIARAAGDLEQARRETIAAIEYHVRKAKVSYVIELYQALADIEMLAHDWAAAEQALDASEALVQRQGGGEWARKLGYQRGRLALHRGQLASAERAFRLYLGQLDSTDWFRRHEARTYLADVFARRGDLALAERELTAASDELDAWRATLTDRALRVWAFQANASDESDENSSVPRVLAALAAGGRADAAFALAERRRARELVERMLQAASLETRHDRQAGSGPVVAPPAHVTAAEVAALLPDDHTALLEYVTGALGAPTTVFVVTRGGRQGEIARAYLLPPADSLAGAIGRFVALVARGADASTEGQALAAALLEPALADLGPEVTRLIIVPDGPLHRVPWDALRLRDGRYVVERYAIGIGPSAAVIAALWRRSRQAPTSQPVRLLAFGDPTFAAANGGTATLPVQDAAAEIYRSAFDSVGGLARLSGSGREARTVARYAPAAEIRLREAASASYLTRTPLTPFRVVHFATHALVDDRTVARTALALAPGDGEDGFVTPGDLAALRLPADLVVLSACRTAGGVVVDGEGIQGLTAPLLQAGARSVVATAWRVGDHSTVRFVDDFYSELARGQPVFEALRAAKLEALRDGAPPNVWAAFTVVGDPLVTIPLRAPGLEWRWWMVAAFALLLGALAGPWIVRRRSSIRKPQLSER